MDSSQTGEGRQVLGAGEVHGNNPPQQPSSEEKLDDLQMRGEGNLLGFGKHWDKTWSYVWFNDQKWVSWAFGKEAAVTAGQEKWPFTSGTWHKLVSFAAWAKRMGLAEARELPSTPGKPARPICPDHGCAMTGPHTANKNALAQNKGKQFFSCPNKCAACRDWTKGPTAANCTGGVCCGKKGFLWADGSEADSEVSHRRKAAYDAAMRAPREIRETGPAPSKRARLDERFEAVSAQFTSPQHRHQCGDGHLADRGGSPSPSSSRRGRQEDHAGGR